MKLKTKIKKKIFSHEYFFYIMVAGALVLSGTAAFFSIYGLSHLFSKARTAVIIMASTLEACKLITVSAYYRFRKLLTGWIKGFLFTSIIILMLITSLGIYSYLTYAFQNVSDKVERITRTENILFDKIKNIDNTLKSETERLNIIKERYLLLNGINKNQENRLNTALKEKNYTTIKNTRNEITMTLAEIQELNRNIESITKKIEKLNNEKNKWNNSIEKNDERTKVVDIGPLKFLSKLLDVNIEIIVNILIIIIVITFDPLAVILVLIANIVYMEKKNGNGKKKKYKKRRKRRKKRRKNDTISNEEDVR